MTLPTIPESIYDAAVNTYFASSHGMRGSILAALSAVWPDLHALAVASLPAAVPAPVVLPTVDEVEKAWRAAIARGERVRDASQAVLDLIGSRVPVWQPVEPGTVIKAGTRYRIEWVDEGAIPAMERTNAGDITVDPTDPARWYIDPRTAPADPDADLVGIIAAALSDTIDGETTCDWTAEARVMLAAIRETHTIEPKPATGPLGGAR